MTTQLEIYKMAAAYMKSGTTISTTADSTPVCNALSMFYENVRQTLICADIWRFATKQVVLSATTTNPSTVWGNAFTLPADFLMPAKVIGDIPYVIRDNLLLTNETTVTMLYVYKVAVTDYPPWFIKLFALALAKECSLVVTQSETLTQLLEQKYRNELDEAKVINSLMGFSDGIRLNGMDQWRSGAIDNFGGDME